MDASHSQPPKVKMLICYVYKQMSCLITMISVGRHTTTARCHIFAKDKASKGSFSLDLRMSFYTCLKTWSNFINLVVRYINYVFVCSTSDNFREYIKREVLGSFRQYHTIHILSYRVKRRL